MGGPWPGRLEGRWRSTPGTDKTCRRVCTWAGLGYRARTRQRQHEADVEVALEAVSAEVDVAQALAHQQRAAGRCVVCDRHLPGQVAGRAERHVSARAAVPVRHHPLPASRRRRERRQQERRPCCGRPARGEHASAGSAAAPPCSAPHRASRATASAHYCACALPLHLRPAPARRGHARALPQVRGALPEQDVSGVGHRQMCEVLVPRCWALKKRVARCLEHSGLVRRSNRSSRLACRLVALICAQGPAPAPAREVLDQFEFW